MAHENVEAVRRGIYAFNCRDMEGLLAELDPAVEWHPALLAAIRGEAAVYRGHEGVRDFVRDLHEAFTELQIEIVEARDIGGAVITEGRLHGRGTGSGAETVTPITYLLDFQNGKVTRVQTFLDHKEALEATGLSEEALRTKRGNNDL
jgi:ketosteroid isomerase-like protein